MNVLSWVLPKLYFWLKASEFSLFCCIIFISSFQHCLVIWLKQISIWKMKRYIVFLFAFLQKLNSILQCTFLLSKKNICTALCSKQIQMIVANREQYPSADKSEPNELVKEVFSKVLPLISRFHLIKLVKVAQINYVSRNHLHCTANLNFGLIFKKAKHCWALSTNFSFLFSWSYFTSCWIGAKNSN